VNSEEKKWLQTRWKAGAATAKSAAAVAATNLRRDEFQIHGMSRGPPPQ